jgi:hypothetical protein
MDCLLFSLSAFKCGTRRQQKLSQKCATSPLKMTDPKLQSYQHRLMSRGMPGCGIDRGGPVSEHVILISGNDNQALFHGRVQVWDKSILLTVRSHTTVSPARSQRRCSGGAFSPNITPCGVPVNRTRVRRLRHRGAPGDQRRRRLQPGLRPHRPTLLANPIRSPIVSLWHDSNTRLPDL